MPETDTTAIASDLMRELFGVLAQANLPCCILRNHEFLTANEPFDNADVDLLVSRDDFKKVDAILKQQGFSRTTETTVSFHMGYIAYPVQGFIFALDLHIGHPSWNDVIYANGSDILANRQIVNDIPIPSDHHTIQLLTLHSILDKKHFKEKYICILKNLYKSQDSPELVQTLFEKQLGSALSRQIGQLLQQNDAQGLMALRKKIVFRLLKLHPICWARLVSCVIRSRWKRLKKRFKPPALLVGLMGPDGAGKTTAINGVCQALERCGISVRQFYMGRWHSHILPLDRAAQSHGATQQVSADAPEESPVEQSDADPVRISGRPVYRLIRDGIYLLEMFLRYALRLHPAKRKRGVVMTDRYAYDLLLDPNATWLLRKTIPTLYPRPNLCFLLYNDPKELHRRKREQSLGEIARQVETYETYQNALNLIPVLSDKPERVAHQITQTILFAFYQKF